MTLEEAKKYADSFNSKTITKEATQSIINAYQNIMNSSAVGSAEYNEAQRAYNGWAKASNLTDKTSYALSTPVYQDTSPAVAQAYTRDAATGTIYNADGNVYSQPSIYNAYGQNGALAKSEAAKATGALDATTRKALEGIASWSNPEYVEYAKSLAGGDPEKLKSIESDYNAAILAAQELKYWNSLNKLGALDLSSIYNAYKNKISTIDSQLKRNEELIAQQRQDAIMSAYANYDRSKSTYGQNAERLANLGLSNSGYSDYLTGVAYSGMIGGLQNADVNANEALQKAYYTADQAKLKAATERDADIAAAKQAYQSKVASLIGLVASSEVDKSTISLYADLLGISPEDVATLTDLGTEVEGNKAKTELDSYFNSNGIYNEDGTMKYLTEEEIRTKAEQAGYSEDEINELVADNNKLVEDANKARFNELASMLNTSMTYETIDKEVGLTPEEKAGLKKELDKLRVEELKAAIKSEGGKYGDIPSLDELKEKEEISEDAYQEAYFEKALSWIEGIDNASEVEEGTEELNRLLHWGKISQKDYDNLKKYLYSKAITEVDNRRFSVDIRGNAATVEFGGKKYDVNLKEASGKAKKFLENVEAKNKTIVEYNNALYLYADGHWRVIGENIEAQPNYNYDQKGHFTTSSNYDSAIELKAALTREANAGYSAKITKPTHQQ